MCLLKQRSNRGRYNLCFVNASLLAWYSMPEVFHIISPFAYSLQTACCQPVMTARVQNKQNKNLQLVCLMRAGVGKSSKGAGTGFPAWNLENGAGKAAAHIPVAECGLGRSSKCDGFITSHTSPPSATSNVSCSNLCFTSRGGVRWWGGDVPLLCLRRKKLFHFFYL